MMDTQNTPQWWWYDGHVHCAAHAEGRFGGALYRNPPPRGADGKEVKPLSGGSPCWECMAAWDVVT